MPPTPPERPSWIKYGISLTCLFGVLAVIYLFQIFFSYQSQIEEQSVYTDIPLGFPQDAPAPKTVDYVVNQMAFDYLVSYTERGFEPAKLTVKKGETVRFTNNSAAEVELSLDADQSESLSHGEYWQYTFSEAGTFSLENGGASMTVKVK